MNGRTRKRRGFTLIEVLVGLAIFALSAVVLSVAYLNVIGSYRALSGRQQQEEDWKWLRMSVLTEPDRSNLEKGGTLPLPSGQQLQWTVTIDPTNVADLFQVKLSGEASPASGLDAWKRAQTFMLLRPAWSDPADRDKLRADSLQRITQDRKS
jgi:general secretion pathway protein I